MIVRNDKTKSNYSSIMKAIQNEIKDIIIDKFISIIMKQNLEMLILKSKYDSIEKLTNKSLKKLILLTEKNPKTKNIKKHLNSPIKQDLNSSNDFMTNSTQFRTAKDTTLLSELNSTMFSTNFSPKVQKIECKKIIFKKTESINKKEKNKKKQVNSKNINNKITTSSITKIRPNCNSPNCILNNKKKSNLINQKEYIITSYGSSEKKLNKKNTMVKFDLDSESYLNLSKKGNLIEPFLRRKERSSSVKAINNNETKVISNSFCESNKKKNNKKYLEYDNSKILNSSSSKNYLNNSSIISQKIRHIKTISDMGNEIIKIQNPFQILKKNFSQSGQFLNVENLKDVNKSPESYRNNNLIDLKNSSIVKISLASENPNSNDNSSIDKKNIKKKY